MSDSTQDIDAATVEVIRNYLGSAATEMHNTLIRTAYNTIIYDILDFGISIYDTDLNLMADSPGLTLFLGANDYAIRRGMEYVGEENLAEGDIVMVNYPYWSSSHTFDAILFSPVFYEGDRVGYTVSRAHLLDIGSSEPGYMIDTTNVHQEGVLFPGTKIYKGGEPDEEIFELLRYNVRLPSKVVGDLNAEIAALHTGRDRLQELYGKYGQEAVEQASAQIIDHGERSAREAVEALPDGTWSAVDYTDGSRTTEDLIRLEVEVTIDGDEFTVDFSGSADQVDGPLNVPYGMTETAAKLCFKTMTTPDEESNEGQYEPLEVVAPEGNIYHATYPAATGTLWPAILAIDLIYKALAKGMPERVPASSGGDHPNHFMYGPDPETGETLTEATNDGLGWGATSEHDGANALLHPSHSNTQNVPVEVLENRVPVRYEQFKLRADSGGPGEYRGGLGIQRDFHFIHPFGALTTFQKTKSEGWGINSGKPGAKNVVTLSLKKDDDDWAERIQSLVDNDDMYPDSDKKHVGLSRGEYKANETISIRTGGGGGYGDPYDRDPEAVLSDVENGYVTRSAARSEYGVAITPEHEIDQQETENLRSE